MSEQPKSLDATFRDYLWKYFALHSDQRLKAFQFYITLATALIGAAAVLLRGDGVQRWIAVFGLLLAFVSFVFWKIDERTRQMIKRAEQGLCHLDVLQALPDIDGAPHPLRIFAHDDHAMQTLRQGPTTTAVFSYTRSFQWVFWTFGVIGVVFAVACATLLPA